MAEAIPAKIGGQPVLILKEGTTRSVGREAQRSNIAAARVVAECVRSSLGPKGMDKMLVASFGDVTITNDGATILKEMDVQNPAAKMMVEVAKAQDQEVGDGTTTAVVLASELLTRAEDLIGKDVHPTVIVDGYRQATEKALQILQEIGIKVEPTDRKALKDVAITSQASKLLSENAEYIADMTVDAILQVAEQTPEGWKVDVDDVKVEKKAGGSLTDTKLIRGVVIDKEVVHPGMPKSIKNPKIALLNSALEVEKTEFDAKINIQRPEQMKAFLDEEERILRGMVEKVKSSGANVLLCQKGIDDVAQHFLAKEGIAAVRRVSEKDMEKLAKATGGKIVTNIEDLKPENLGSAELFEERRVADDKMVFVEGCRNPKAVSILVRGGTERIVNEAERAIHDALCVVRDVVREPQIVAGGGAPELEVAAQIKRWAEKLTGKEQLAVISYAEALESIPMTLAENAGLDPIDILVELRARHEKGERWAGVDVYDGKVKDMSKVNIYEPLAVKTQVVKSASEAASMILKIDDVISAGKPKEPSTPPKSPGAGEEESSSEFD
ncbi:TCP-1/cpn60 chaperonin family protein [Candidatus Bathyarchaeota archaeon]|nr:TCP-1/cpn60 chaperonin family protein [Candidatus Bathyarchaeota archaeon]